MTRAVARRESSGAEPSAARSALVLRAVLAAFGALVCGGFSGLALVGAAGHDDRRGLLVFGLGTAVLALVALVDIVVLVRRIRQERRPWT
ncbi:hypothetical protein CLV35_1901 [Motilibacter peucedani]|uniref:Uncharacterized protein n=1 Tax=Motilibacter peucedani TaxID=598650 RepID=A0A420XQA7_9ACTN|nr:DUF6343 family protein [Motilibacter peucedani]RKS75435.1 hypothetical protein CLV35_1901 [Motilibacter peucedani]